MPIDAAQTGSYEPDRGGDEAAAHTLAVLVLSEMRKLRILPTPHHYELWFTFRSRTNDALSQRIERLLDGHVTITSTILSALHNEFIAYARASAAVEEDAAEELCDIAADLSDGVATGKEAARSYSRALSAMSGQLGSGSTVGSLVEALGTMALETSRASERNRQLEHQLAASVARIDKLRRSLSASKAEASTDPLTGLLNRRALEARLRRALVQLRSEPEATFSVLMLDVNHFKKFNDQHGHAAGDFVLRMLGRLLTESVKGRDAVARYGGEEFILLLPGTPLKSAGIVARQISALLSDKRLVHRSTQKNVGAVTLSIGVAEARPSDNLVSLIERADAALYEAKSGGRNQVRLEASHGAIP